jgi:multidrug transporter EmrE-like cation transporter
VKSWLFLSAAIVSEVAASLSLKGALDAPAWYLLVVAGYAASFVRSRAYSTTTAEVRRRRRAERARATSMSSSISCG